VEHVRSIFEGSGKLSGIDGQCHVGSRGIHGGVLSEGSILSIGVPVNESSSGGGSSCSKVQCGNVVSDSEGTVAVIVGDASLVGLSGHGPVVVGIGGTIGSISEMVVSRKRGLEAVGSGLSKRWNLGPDHSSGSTSSLGDGLSLGSLGVSADVSGLDVE
jgi:hypothetical protein